MEEERPLEQHPLSAAFPAMPANELGALALDIQTHGQREPAVMLDGMVLDGWHRYLACQQVGAEFRSVPFDGADPVAFVLSRNLHRRHLTVAQRVTAVAECAKWATVGRPENRGSASPILTTRQIAEAADASEKTVKQVKAAIRAGLGDALRSGDVSAERAAEIAKLPKAKRAKALKEPKPPKEKKPRVVIAERKFEKLYEEVKAELAETKEALAALADTAASVEAFKNDEQFKAMQVLREEMRSVKRRRDELMRENAELKKQISHWKKKAEKK